MQEVINTIKDTINFEKDSLGDDDDEHSFRTCAKKWSNHAINTYNGELLKKALEVSRTLANFANEIESDDK